MEPEQFIERREAALEALLFASSAPLTARILGEVTGWAVGEVEEALDRLADELAQRGVNLMKSAGAYHLATHPFAASFIEKLRQSGSRHHLSRAALETLAVIAYRQPVTRTQIEQIRGVNSDSALNTLADKQLVREIGRAPVLGRPMLFGTTREFLRYFGLDTVEELPALTGDGTAILNALSELPEGTAGGEGQALAAPDPEFHEAEDEAAEEETRRILPPREVFVD